MHVRQMIFKNGKIFKNHLPYMQSEIETKVTLQNKSYRRKLLYVMNSLNITHGRFNSPNNI